MTETLLLAGLFFTALALLLVGTARQVAGILAAVAFGVGLILTLI